MSFLKTNKEAAGTGFEPVKPGKYEVVISEVKLEKTGPNSQNPGTDMLNLTLTIRSNVEQDFKKRKLFDRLVASEKAMFKFHQVGTAVLGDGIEVGTIQEFAKAIKNQCVKVTVTNRKETYEGQERIRENISFYAPSDYPVGGGESDEGFNAFEDDGEAPVISDNDLPF